MDMGSGVRYKRVAVKDAGGGAVGDSGLRG
jgi:hypothetical protein